MAELKTLKDLTRKYVKTSEWDDNRTETVEWGNGCDADDLRQEAIKWIKEFQTEADDGPAERGTIFWIQHFFNITDEELQGDEK